MKKTVYLYKEYAVLFIEAFHIMVSILAIPK